MKADLSRIEALTALLDRPERTYPTIHIAGTNGKSTTARMIGAILAAHGLNSGVYTSPHLQSVRERFAFGGAVPGGVTSEIMAPEEFAAVTGYLAPFVETVESERGDQVTYFELTTSMAFEWMSERTVAAGVFEAGMGGTWDATNVVLPEVAVLSHIAVDHTEFLGTTPAQNAREKVGIIKTEGRVVTAAQDPEVLDLIRVTCTERNADLVALGYDLRLVSDDLAVGGRVISVAGIHAEYPEVFVPLHGAHQGANAALAIGSAEQFLGKALDDEAVRAGLATVQSPGRLEVVGRDPLVVLDGAHNPHGASALADAIEESFVALRRTLVVAILSTKDVEGILTRLVPISDRMIFTTSSHPKSSDPDELAERARALGASDTAAEPEIGKAVTEAISRSAPDELILITGSLYAVGDARDLLVGPVE
ncbi:MAG: bifunctional folylpolyglutamate synthase/dihydrofolate synthase [Actinomycetota bacterium]